MGFTHRYVYTLNVTGTGMACVNWWEFAAIIPPENLDRKARVHDDYFYPDGSIRNASNYCRNPYIDDFPVWCYTAFDKYDYEYCYPSKCPDIDWYNNAYMSNTVTPYERHNIQNRGPYYWTFVKGHNLYMMTSSNGNIFRVTGCGEFTGHRWVPLTKTSDAELLCFLICAYING